MDLNLETKQLANLLAKPEMVTQADVAMLNSLAVVYPYYKPLYLLLAKANSTHQSHKHAFAKAALYNGGEILHKVVHQPEKLTLKHLNLVIAGAKTEDIRSAQAEIAKNTEAKKANESVNQFADEQETFEEITEVDATIFATNTESVTKNETDAAPDELAIENIVATDFFAFEENFNTDQATSELQKTTAPLVEEYNQEAEAQTVSKYNDEKLPYSFLWWLAKTRKEHEQIFQPYVTTKKTNPNANANELQQQYVEHIFHLQTPFNIAEEAQKGPINKHISKKGDSIIDSFIKNEPQIKPPKPEQINNENKAKKSAEDQNDLVSETLAAIYIEQMLYQKAIDIYAKLSLKFPEKSRYFANLIKSLEKKI